MREISVNTIKKVVKKLCIEANYYLPKDVDDKIVQCREVETWNIAREVLQTIEENIHIARKENIPYVRIQVWHVYLLKWVKMFM